MKMVRKSQANPGPEPKKAEVTITQEHINAANRDRYNTGIFGRRTPEMYARGVKMQNIGGQDVYAVAGSSATMAKGGGDVVFIKNKGSNTFTSAVMKRGATGQPEFQLTDERNLTPDDILDKTATFQGGFITKAEEVVKRGGMIESKGGAISAPERGTSPETTTPPPQGGPGAKAPAGKGSKQERMAGRFTAKKRSIA